MLVSRGPGAQKPVLAWIAVLASEESTRPRQVSSFTSCAPMCPLCSYTVCSFHHLIAELVREVNALVEGLLVLEVGPPLWPSRARIGFLCPRDGRPRPHAPPPHLRWGADGRGLNEH